MMEFFQVLILDLHVPASFQPLLETVKTLEDEFSSVFFSDAMCSHP